MGQSAIEVQRRIAAPAADLFHLITDPQQMVRWNPAFDDVEWLHGTSTTEKGARFQVHNVNARFDWEVEECVVIENDGTVTFAFARVVRDRDAAIHRYVLRPSGAVTEVVLSYEVLWQPWPERVRDRFRDRSADARRAMNAALAGLEQQAVVGSPT